MLKSRQRPQSNSQQLLPGADIDFGAEDDDDDKKSSRKEIILVALLLLTICLYCFKSTIETNIAYLSSSAEASLAATSVSITADSADSNLESFKNTKTSLQLDSIQEDKEKNENTPISTSVSRDVRLAQQVEKCDNLILEIREMKKRKIVMETDSQAQEKISILQSELRRMFQMEYGPDVTTFKVEMKLKFPSSMPDYVTAGDSGTILIETAPISLVPYAVYMFLQISKNLKSGSFHRNAGHVLQSMVTAPGVRGMAFQEYHPDFPHKRLTLGYAGRPGGPAFYISTVDNTRNHGPGSQGSKTEADGCFGRIIEGEDVVKRMQKQPGRTKPSGFIDKPSNFIKIESLTILEPKPLLSQ